MEVVEIAIEIAIAIGIEFCISESQGGHLGEESNNSILL
ncbi:MAG: hypothetical protein ACD_75C02456G0004 [uncultured bacterium]|nr:MAG: hypothetical protein ACD_75C02456G0004 [uncultured bacterium]